MFANTLITLIPTLF